ncbi:MAG: hypothetical protein EXS35_15690 [Pedosphaera sp.]|nr:hypothetical protein [Pedosphaera sp.]
MRELFSVRRYSIFTTYEEKAGIKKGADFSSPRNPSAVETARLISKIHFRQGVGVSSADLRYGVFLATHRTRRVGDRRSDPRIVLASFQRSRAGRNSRVKYQFILLDRIK